MKTIKLILILIILLSASLGMGTQTYAQDDPYNLSAPTISQGNVTDGSYFYGPITLESSVTEENTSSTSDKEAYYSLDGGNTWSQTGIDETVSLKNGLFTITTSILNAKPR